MGKSYLTLVLNLQFHTVTQCLLINARNGESTCREREGVFDLYNLLLLQYPFRNGDVAKLLAKRVQSDWSDCSSRQSLARIFAEQLMVQTYMRSDSIRTIRVEMNNRTGRLTLLCRQHPYSTLHYIYAFWPKVHTQKIRRLWGLCSKLFTLWLGNHVRFVLFFFIYIYIYLFITNRVLLPKTMDPQSHQAILESIIFTLRFK